MSFTKKTYNVDEALAKLQRYCAYQDRCHKEVAQKLKDMQMIPQASEQIITTLIEENFLKRVVIYKRTQDAPALYLEWH